MLQPCYFWRLSPSGKFRIAVAWGFAMTSVKGHVRRKVWPWFRKFISMKADDIALCIRSVFGSLWLCVTSISLYSSTRCHICKDVKWRWGEWRGQCHLRNVSCRWRHHEFLSLYVRKIIWCHILQMTSFNVTFFKWHNVFIFPGAGYTCTVVTPFRRI